MGDCDGCAFLQDCPESCVDCWCVLCVRHAANSNCCLDAVVDYYSPEEATSDE
jgi:hypothetical protein